MFNNVKTAAMFDVNVNVVWLPGFTILIIAARVGMTTVLSGGYTLDYSVKYIHKVSVSDVHTGYTLYNVICTRV